MIEDAIARIVADAVRGAVAPLAAEVAQLRRALDDRDRWITRADAAGRLGVSLDTIDRSIVDGSIVAQRVGRAVRVDAASLVPASEAEITRMAHGARS